MPLDFPGPPLTVGQIFADWKWDGAKWVSVGAGGTASVTVSDSPPSSPVSGALWWSSLEGQMYLYYTDPNTSQWIVCNNVGASLINAALQGNPTAPTPPVGDADTSVATTAFVAASAGVDALALNGMQINGNMIIGQELGTTTRATQGYVCDGWQWETNTATAVMSAGRYSPIFPPTLPFTSMIAITVSTASPSLGTTDYSWFIQRIEGVRVARLNFGQASAQPVTVCFWTAHHRTGIYSVSLRNKTDNRGYATTYTQNVVDTWQYNTVTIPGDVTGTWVTDNTEGLDVGFAMACGTGSLTASAANTWLAANVVAAPGQVNGIAATTDVFRLTGVAVLPGSQVPTAVDQPNIFRPYDQELLTCRRYFYNGVPPLRGVAEGTTAQGAGRMACRHPVQMRAAPTLTITAALPVYDGTTPTTITNINTNYTTNDTLEINGDTGAIMALGRACLVYQGAGGNLNVDARL
jgi:hypothetical protein